uniref:KIB1-4 beta-propeller domain-containing protein n=1 Tax=Ananas comosus var. bracteatus TaxID=296719 RepID=A0A6V7PDJ2_ANACO|nr:unnamed protein product [Ananas comosus var. bracteatus]
MWRSIGHSMLGPVDSIAVFDFQANPAFQRFRRVSIPENNVEKNYANFFIELAGDLLLISRHRELTAGRILVHRLPPLEGDGPFVLTPLASIGDRALFLGTGNTVAVHAPDFPLSVRRNSIYFTDVHRRWLFEEWKEEPMQQFDPYNHP